MKIGYASRTNSDFRSLRYFGSLNKCSWGISSYVDFPVVIKLEKC